jgi:hypothetical protein
MGVAVDDPNHRLAGQFLDLREQRLSPSGNLRVDDGDAVAADEDRRVTSTAPQDE